MNNPFFHKRKNPIEKLGVSQHQNINVVLNECFNATRTYDSSRAHFGKFDVVSYLNVKQ